MGKKKRRLVMKAPSIGRAFSALVLLGCVIWWGVRVSSGHPAEPKGTFPAPSLDASLAARPAKETAVFAGGCFWGGTGSFSACERSRTRNIGIRGRQRCKSVLRISVQRQHRARRISTSDL